jgi:Ca2+-binding RTX toxin-like protein
MTPVHFAKATSQLDRSASSDAPVPAPDDLAPVIETTPGPDIVGTAGGDVLSGTLLPERMYGLGGDDVLYGSAGADHLDGGDGFDTVDYSGSERGVYVVLYGWAGYNIGDVAGDTYVSIEAVRGSIFDDALFGTNGDDVLIGNGGNDSLYGYDGDDRFEVVTPPPPSPFADSNSGLRVSGGNGYDTIAVSGAVTFDMLFGIEAFELAPGSHLTLYQSQISYSLTPDVVFTGTGKLTINTASFSTAGSTLSAHLWLVGSGVTITINGSSGIDVMKLANAVQTVNGGDGADQIKGGNLVDTVHGGAGKDKIMGQGGADILTGGAGSDVFKFLSASDSGPGTAADRVTDFTIGQDRLNFVQIDANAALDGDQAFTFLGTAAFAVTGLGQLRYLTSGSDLIVQADVNGDGVADMEVILQGIGGQVLTGADFVL